MTDPITLEFPIKRGETEIREVALRRPKSGDLRGIKIVDVLQLDVDALIKLVPRISQPTLTEQEVAGLDPADLTQIGNGVAGFFLPSEALQSV